MLKFYFFGKYLILKDTDRFSVCYTDFKKNFGLFPTLRWKFSFIITPSVIINENFLLHYYFYINLDIKPKTN